MNLTLTNLHPFHPLPSNKWRKVIKQLVALVFEESNRFKDFNLSHLNIVWIDDSKMAELNQRYLKHQGSTDILTFGYNNDCAEILISLDTAWKQAQRYHQSFENELMLYLVHGILHLVGFKDKTPLERRRMRCEERRLMQKLTGS